MKRSWQLLIWVFLLTPPAAQPQAWSGIISATRAADWTTAGVIGGIPSASWSQCGATIAAYGSSGSYASPSTINNAIAGTGAGYTGCSTPYVIVLGSGDFYLSGGITLVSNVALRGQGANSTRLHFSADAGCGGWTAAVCIGTGGPYGGGGWDTANWTSGYSQGTTTITIDSITSHLVVGQQPLILDQCNTGMTGTAGSDTCSGTPADNFNLYVCNVSNTTLNSGCSSQGDATGLHLSNRAQEEVDLVASCKATTGTCASGTGPYTLTLKNPISWPGWSSGQTPRARWCSAAPITNAGIEDFYIDQAGLGSPQRSVSFVCASNSWEMGIASYKPNLYHFFSYFSDHITMRDSYIFGTLNAGTTSYGFGAGVSGDLLIENNISQAVVDTITFDSQCSRCVVGYNFSVNDFNNTTAYMWPQVSCHSSGISDLLVEGNIGAQWDCDDIWGTHTMSTAFRNYMIGYESNNGTMPTDNAVAMHIAAFSRYFNIVGNVFGNPLHQTSYICAPPTATTSKCSDVSGNQWTHSVDYGWSGNTFGMMALSGSPNDVLTYPTMLNWGNYDVATKAVRWCGNSSDTGWSAICGGGSATISSCTSSTNTMTCTLAGSTTIPVGTQLIIVGNSIGGYNVTRTVSASSSGSFTYFDPVSSGLSTGTGGTITYGSEVPTADPYYPNSLPTLGDIGAGQSRMPSSFYNGVTGTYPSCGTGLTFWKNPTLGACPPYPPIGPDVTAGTLLACSGGTYKYSIVTSASECGSGATTETAYPLSTGGSAGVASAIPAMLCYSQMGGPPDGTGNMLSFNAASCYAMDSSSGGSGGGSGSQPPIAPTGLIATVE